MRFPLAALLLVLLMPAARAEDPKPPAVSVVSAITGEIVETARVTGTLLPRDEIVVGVDVTGLRILELLADAGDVVTKDQLIARLDPATIEIEMLQNVSQIAKAEAAIAQARAQIAQAEATRAEADSALIRTQALKRSGVTAADSLEQRVAAAKVAAAQADAAQQGLKAAEADRAVLDAAAREIALRRSKTEIRAPAAGLILSRAALVGAIVSPAAEPLFRIARDGLIELQAEASETELSRFTVGMEVEVQPSGSAESLTGTVRVVWPEIDATTRLGGLRVALPVDPRLRAGAFARGTVVRARRTGVLLPVSVLQGSGQAVTVQVVSDGKVAVRPVTTGLRTDRMVEILSGVTADETVVVRSGSFLQDGDRVTPVVVKAEEATQ